MESISPHLQMFYQDYPPKTADKNKKPRIKLSPDLPDPAKQAFVASHMPF